MLAARWSGRTPMSPHKACALPQVWSAVQVCKVYLGSFNAGAPIRSDLNPAGQELFQKEQAALLNDLYEIPQRSCDRKVCTLVCARPFKWKLASHVRLSWPEQWRSLRQHCGTWGAVAVTAWHQTANVGMHLTVDQGRALQCRSHQHTWLLLLRKTRRTHAGQRVCEAGEGRQDPHPDHGAPAQADAGHDGQAEGAGEAAPQPPGALQLCAAGVPPACG